MANRMIAIALLSIGMLAMNKSAAIWKSVLNSEVLSRTIPEPSSRLFITLPSAESVFPSAEAGEDFQEIQRGNFGMNLHSCTDEYGVDWRYVVLEKKEKGTYFTGWIPAESVSSIPPSGAPVEWAQIHQNWGW